MSKDIRPIVAGWDYDPEDIQVRIITGEDGLETLQLRLDLGLLQMNLDGRPDGQRPHGAESLLDLHEQRAQSEGATSYSLDASDCEALMREGVQYYHRYVALFHLGRYDLVARDTARNLRLFDFVRRHAERRRDRLAFDQYRPYVLMMHTRALAHQCLDRDDPKGALDRIDRGIGEIEAFLREYDQQERAGDCQELVYLRQWRTEVDRDRTADPVERLEEQLGHAVSREDYEEAARIRDQIDRLRDLGPGSSHRHPGPRA